MILPRLSHIFEVLVFSALGEPENSETGILESYACKD
jgi:hypothetical protein